MKSLGKPWYTQSQYDQASAVYMRYCCDQALHEGRPLPTQPAKLPLMRPPYGRMGAGVCKAISMHLGIAVLWVRLFFLATTCLFGAGLIAYIFLWMALPVGDPIQQTYIIAGKRSPWQAPLSRGNMPYGTYPVSPEYQSFTAPQDGPHPQPPSFEDTTACNDGTHGDTQSSSESLEQTLKKAPKPALLALAGLMLLSICFVMFAGGVERTLIVPLLLGLVGIGVSWLRFNAEEGQLWTMLGGIAIIFAAYALYVSSCMHFDAFSMIRILCAGLALLIGALLAIVPWIMALIRDLGTERASKEREEERADMTAHLHDGVLQTLALIQLHADDQQTVFSLARSQERELREWLYQERTTSDRSVNAGLKEIAAHVEDTHGKPIEVVTVGDARPSAQTDALLDATQQALINAVAHGGEPISVYCEASSKLVEVFVRDHGNGFDMNAIPANRLGIRESIIGRIKRRGGTVEIVSRPQWGTEVRMHMPIADMPASAAADTNAQQSHEPQSNSQQTDFPNHHNRQSNNQRTNQFSNQPTNHFEEQQ